MPVTLDLELGVAAYKVVRDLLKIKKGESLLITIDSVGHWRLAEETAKAGEALGAKVMVAWHSTPPGYGKVGDPYLPDSLKAAIPQTDAWVEYNNQWLLYSTPWEKALSTPDRVRYLFLGGLDEEQIVRCVGKVDLELQDAFQTTLVNLTKKAKKMRITTPAGTDVSFENGDRPVTNELWADKPGAHFLLGQMGWAPIEESINGRIVFDGSFSGGGEADLGILAQPITFHVENGVCVDITGGEEAKFLRGWFERLNDPFMYHAAHVCYGFNPGARLSGLCTEDERVWGSTEWGFGYQGPFFKAKGIKAVSHVDGICLNSSVWLDGEQIMDEGRLLHPELAELARKIGKQ
ncbi:MAG: leucyl aminopeptidase [Anaerolineae bacterium]